MESSGHLWPALDSLARRAIDGKPDSTLPDRALATPAIIPYKKLSKPAVRAFLASAACRYPR